jgi:hypothetical protein
MIVGNVPFGMKPNRLRWVVKTVTGVTPLSVTDGRKTKDGRRPTGLFFIKVRAEDVQGILDQSGLALCCPEVLFARPSHDAALVASVAAELKLGGIVRNGLLKFDVQIPRANGPSTVQDP